ncbi:hypothetical protein VME0621_03099 [Vibrio mediterranei]|uniref:Ribosomal subunit interface protein n=1 Tax=Vibrio mediterranei TaxID=689 RepID=A0ABX5DF24_9VIBR|nr:HPF/RaiA family ribosome-associated protein [Vibrio mediterranei]MCG9662978.1 HPF/RaiA family ribosome-associated protein [Vibrio mediterranei]PCD89318.1 hypothetical protein COR52_05140 [Vibrio mediterranei]PRQ68320.1 hypothetical protein COR51_07685 [Vibrio mediterranei]SBO10964.1 hypothetical protein VME0621_03099 [Vibrio mediterranei]
MNIHFNTQSIVLSESMRSHCVTKADHLFVVHPQATEIFVSIIHHRSYGQYDVELKVHTEHQWCFVKHSGDEFYHVAAEAFSAMTHKLQKQKTKAKRELRDHSLEVEHDE